jgi:type IV pilus assembly protein PilE
MHLGPDLYGQATSNEDTTLKKLRGFTLIELLIVIVIVAVLAAIALPSDQEHVRKTRRTQAKADMLEITQMLEREFTLNRSYAGFDTDSFKQSPRSGKAYYDITFEPEPLDNTYRIIASPKDSQLQDTKCGELSLNHLGTKTADGSLGVSGCW